MDMFSRTEMLLGAAGMDKLRECEITVIGLGGVGSYAAEALARAGVGRLNLIDADTVCVTNINRQIIALNSTLGRPKAELMRERIQEINPSACVRAVTEFVGPDNITRLLPQTVDYVLDAIDTVTSKLAIAEYCTARNIPLISSMGTGNKILPERLMLADIYDTSVCPLARVMRRELRKRGIERLTVCYSTEEPITPANAGNTRLPGSVSFVPPVAGMMMAGKAVRDIVYR